MASRGFNRDHVLREKQNMAQNIFNPNIGWRTGQDVRAGKTVGCHEDGFARYEDYWTESETESSMSMLINERIKELEEDSVQNKKKKVLQASAKRDPPLRSMSPFTPDEETPVATTLSRFQSTLNPGGEITGSITRIETSQHPDHNSSALESFRTKKRLTYSDQLSEDVQQTATSSKTSSSEAPATESESGAAIENPPEPQEIHNVQCQGDEKELTAREGQSDKSDGSIHSGNQEHIHRSSHSKPTDTQSQEGAKDVSIDTNQEPSAENLSAKFDEDSHPGDVTEKPDEAIESPDVNVSHSERKTDSHVQNIDSVETQDIVSLQSNAPASEDGSHMDESSLLGVRRSSRISKSRASNTSSKKRTSSESVSAPKPKESRDSENLSQGSSVAVDDAPKEGTSNPAGVSAESGPGISTPAPEGNQIKVVSSTKRGRGRPKGSGKKKRSPKEVKNSSVKDTRESANTRESSRAANPKNDATRCKKKKTVRESDLAWDEIQEISIDGDMAPLKPARSTGRLRQPVEKQRHVGSKSRKKKSLPVSKNSNVGHVIQNGTVIGYVHFTTNLEQRDESAQDSTPNDLSNESNADQSTNGVSESPPSEHKTNQALEEQVGEVTSSEKTDGNNVETNENVEGDYQHKAGEQETLVADNVDMVEAGTSKTSCIELPGGDLQTASSDIQTAASTADTQTLNAERENDEKQVPVKVSCDVADVQEHITCQENEDLAPSLAATTQSLDSENTNKRGSDVPQSIAHDTFDQEDSGSFMSLAIINRQTLMQSDDSSIDIEMVDPPPKLTKRKANLKKSPLNTARRSSRVRDQTQDKESKRHKKREVLKRRISNITKILETTGSVEEEELSEGLNQNNQSEGLVSQSNAEKSLHPEDTALREKTDIQSQGLTDGSPDLPFEPEGETANVQEEEESDGTEEQQAHHSKRKTDKVKDKNKRLSKKRVSWVDGTLQKSQSDAKSAESSTESSGDESKTKNVEKSKRGRSSKISEPVSGPISTDFSALDSEQTSSQISSYMDTGTDVYTGDGTDNMSPITDPFMLHGSSSSEDSQADTYVAEAAGTPIPRGRMFLENLGRSGKSRRSRPQNIPEIQSKRRKPALLKGPRAKSGKKKRVSMASTLVSTREPSESHETEEIAECSTEHERSQSKSSPVKTPPKSPSGRQSRSPLSGPRSILKKTPLPRDSAASPLHFNEMTTTEPREPVVVENKIIEPKEAPPGLRRSQRTRVKPLDWYLNEHILYERRKSGGFAIAGIAPPINKESSPMLNKKRKKRVRRRIPGTPRNLSIHGELPSELGSSSDSEIPVMNPASGEEELIECVRLRDSLLHVGPEGKPAEQDDPFVMCKALAHDTFSLGEVIIRPLMEKEISCVLGCSLAFIVKTGKVAVSIHRSVALLESGDMFLVPKGNTYCIQNLRDEEAKLYFFESHE